MSETQFSIAGLEVDKSEDNKLRKLADDVMNMNINLSDAVTKADNISKEYGSTVLHHYIYAIRCGVNIV